MLFQEVLIKRGSMAGINSSSQKQGKAHDIEGLSVVQSYSKPEDELELLKQIDQKNSSNLSQKE